MKNLVRGRGQITTGDAGMTVTEMIAEWRKGCSCPECTAALIEAIGRAGEQDKVRIATLEAELLAARVYDRRWGAGEL